MIRIETQRLIIRDHILEDLPSYHRLMSDQESMFFLPDLFSTSLEESRRTLDIAIDETNMDDDRARYFWGIFLKDKTYLGEIGYTVSSVDDLGNKNVQLGYFIQKDHWNHGYVSEAVTAVIDYAFDFDKVIKIETGCLCDNLYSERIMIKLGFQKEASKKQHQWLNGKWYDRVEYGLSCEQYNQEIS